MWRCVYGESRPSGRWSIKHPLYISCLGMPNCPHLAPLVLDPAFQLLHVGPHQVELVTGASICLVGLCKGISVVLLLGKCSLATWLHTLQEPFGEAQNRLNEAGASKWVVAPEKILSCMTWQSTA